MTREEQIDAAWAQRTGDPKGNQRIDLGGGKSAFASELRHRLAGEQNWRCCYCHCDMALDPRARDGATIEHIVARADGGSNHISNIAIACQRCNSERGSVIGIRRTIEREAQAPWRSPRLRQIIGQRPPTTYSIAGAGGG